MGELYDRLVEPYLADFEKDWVDKVDPLEIKKVIEEMRKDGEALPITEFIAVEIDGETRRVHVPFTKDIYEFFEKWLGNSEQK